MKPNTKQAIKPALKFVTVGLLIGLLIGAFIAYGQSPTSTFTISSGVYPGSPSYTIWNEGSDYFAKDANGLIAYSGTNASQIINSAVSGGSSIFIKAGYYPIDSAILVPANSEAGASTVKTIYGETLTGDAYFTKLQNVIPSGTVLAATSGFTGSIFDVGYNAASLVGVRNFEVSHLTISGLPLPNVESGTASIDMASDCAGIKATNLINAKIHDITFLNCYSALYVTTNGWTNDGVEIYHCWAAYNNWGFYVTGQTQVLSIHNTYTYLNYMGGYYLAGVSIDMQDLTSIADSYEVETVPNSAMVLISNGYIRGRGLYIQCGKDATKDASRGINLNIGYENATIDLSQVLVQGVNGNGIILTDNDKYGFVFLNRIYASPSSTGYLGGDGGIKDYGFIDNENDGIDIVVSESVFQNYGYAGLIGTFLDVTKTYNGTDWIP